MLEPLERLPRGQGEAKPQNKSRSSAAPLGLTLALKASLAVNKSGEVS
jgi:hypothetical protein